MDTMFQKMSSPGMSTDSSLSDSASQSKTETSSILSFDPPYPDIGALPPDNDQVKLSLLKDDWSDYHRFNFPSRRFMSISNLEMKKQKPELLVDRYLSTLGLWRKPVARDGFSLFRAVSEQLFQTQTFYKQLYDACRVVFTLCGKNPETDWVEEEVMKILSSMYRVDFLVYDLDGQPPLQATLNGFDKKILLCRIDESHVDSVYSGSFVQDAAICQSIIYEILYRGVFKLDTELSEAVTLIREQNKKKFSYLVNRLDMSNFSDSATMMRRCRTDSQLQNKDRIVRRVTPPVPYRIAKALDPNIYRNVELDIWEEEKRELLKEHSVTYQKFAAGDKCQENIGGSIEIASQLIVKVIFDESEVYHGHIQELSENEGPVLVYIEEIGAKRMVPFNSLKPAPVKYTQSVSSASILGRSPRWRKDMPVASTTPPPLLPPNHKAYTTQPGELPRDRHQRSPRPDLDNNNCPSAFNNFNNNNDNNIPEYFPGMMRFPPVPMVANLNNSYVNMASAGGITPPGQTSGDNKPLMTTGQVPPPHVVQRCAPPMVPTPMQAPYMYPPNMGAMTNQGYSCVSVPFLETFNLNQVSLNCGPSQDPAGKDLPMSEINTLRFFFNLGIEYYHLISQGSIIMGSPVEMGPGQMMPTADQVNGNTCGQFLVPPPPLLPSSAPNSEDKKSQAGDQLASSHVYPMVYPVHQATTFGAPNPQADTSLPSAAQLTLGEKTSESKLSDEACADCNDSGCDSDSVSGSGHDDSFKDGAEKAADCQCDDLASGPVVVKGDKSVHETASITSSLDIQEQSSTIAIKPKGKRKYYMYGNHKLIKPIKEIPPRFLTMLAESSATRQRCEGEPIIVPFLPPRPRYFNRFQHPFQHIPGVNGFNPEAKCFVPGQPLQTDPCANDPSIVACSSQGDGSSRNNHAYFIPNSEGAQTFSAGSSDTPMCPPLPPRQPPYTLYVYGSPSFNATNLNNESASNGSTSGSPGGGNSNPSCMPSHSAGAGQPFLPGLPCPVYYTNQQFPMPAPQPCLPGPHGVPPAPGQMTFSGLN